MKSLPDLRLTVENAPDEIPKLLHVVKPSWNKDRIKLKKLSGGFSCLMYICFNEDDSSDGVTVRARTNTFQDFPHVRESAFEAKVLHTMNVNDLFPEVVATFQNGYCYSYIPGTPLFNFMANVYTGDEARARLMARKLAEINSIRMEGCDYTKTSYFKNLYLLLKEKYPVGDRLPAGCPTREELEREMKQVEEKALQADSPLVLVHGDPHPGNIVYNEEKDTVTYVDWEMTHIGYQAEDVAYALQIFKFIGMNPELKMKLAENHERNYIRYYLEKWFEIQGKSESDVTEEDVDKLEFQTRAFRLSAQLFWVIILAAQHDVGFPDHIDTDAYAAATEKLSKVQPDEKLTPEPNQSADDKPLPQDPHIQMVAGLYAGYLSSKDEFLSNIQKE